MVAGFGGVQDSGEAAKNRVHRASISFNLFLHPLASVTLFQDRLRDLPPPLRYRLILTALQVPEDSPDKVANLNGFLAYEVPFGDVPRIACHFNTNDLQFFLLR